MTKKSTMIALAAVMFTASAFGLKGIALAETTKSSSSWKSSQDHIKNYLKHAPGVMGKVTAINGLIVTISGKSNITYTIDTSTAKIVKNRNTIITIGDVKVGDRIMAQGTVTGTNVLATTVFDGKPLVGKKNRGNFPGVMGVVSNVSGTTFSVTVKDGTVYSVNATNAKIEKGTPPVAATLSDIVNGDTVMVRGAVTGTAVTAESVFDGKIMPHPGKSGHKK